MKKTLCILLALLMLALTACQTTPDAGNDKSKGDAESSVTAPPTPWSELKALLESFDPMVAMPDAFQNMMVMSEDISGTGTYSVAMSMAGLSGGDSEIKSGTVTMDGPVVKMEATEDILGVQVPVITWTDGNVSYIQYPTLYPDKVFNSEDIASSSGAGSVPSMSGMDIAALPDQMISILEEVADPHKDMTVSETDGTFTYTLVMDAETGGKLFDKIDAILAESGASDILGSGGDILGQLGGSGETAEKEEVSFDSAVFTVTTDKFATLNYSLQKLQGDTTVESIRLDTLATETSLTYTIEKKTGDTVDMALTVAVSETAVTLKGEITADAATKVKIDLTVTCTEETTIALDGTLNVEMSQGGLSLSIPLDISGTVSVTDEKMTMDIGVTMEMMGMGMNAEMNYDITFGDITLEIPFDEDDVMEYDPEAFAEKLLEVYPELNSDEF